MAHLTHVEGLSVQAEDTSCCTLARKIYLIAQDCLDWLHVFQGTTYGSVTDSC